MVCLWPESGVELYLSGGQPELPGKTEKVSNSERAERTTEAALEKRAAAHAHYAAGVIHDLNNEPALALEEYRKAASDDPEDESLVLEVSAGYSRKSSQKRRWRCCFPRRRCRTLRVRFSRGWVSPICCLGKARRRLRQTAWRSASPSSIAGYQNLFLAYLQNKQPDEALRVLDDAAKQQNADAEFLIDFGEM